MKNIKNIATSIRNNSLTAVIDNKVYTADNTHPNWEAILDAVRINDGETLIDLINIRQSVINFVEGKIQIVGNEASYNGLNIGGVVVDRLLEFISNKLPATPIVRFIENLYSNPSKRAVEELYTFLEHKNMPITNNGTFLAYKGLQDDFYSKTSGTLTLLQGRADAQGHIFNGVGETIECVRNQVDDNKENHCSKGIHAGSMEYATSFACGGKVVIVEINPKDVVSIPNDCECQKLRTCKYKVVGEYEMPLNSTYTGQYNDDGSDEFGSDEVDGEGDAQYEDGYDQGYKDGKENREDGEAKVSFSGLDTYDSYDLGYIDGYIDGYASTVAPTVKSDSYINGYIDGYPEGRTDSKEHNVNFLKSVGWTTPTDDYDTGYDAGYADGWGHKSRKH